MTDSKTSGIVAKSYAVHSVGDKFELFDVQRRVPRDDDIVIKILFCGICHSDIHQAKNEWHNSTYPMVPGHEITGVVEQIGSKVQKVQIGDHVGVGCLVDSCLDCRACKRDLEQHCPDSCITYNSTELDKKTPTYGGYSTYVIVRDHFVCKIPKNLPLDGAAPLLCAGITTYSPMRQHNVGQNTRMAVVGLGGLGHMAVKFGVALGAHVTVISTSESKRNDAMKLGAHAFVISKDPEQLKDLARSFQFILDTVSAKHDVQALVQLLDFEGTFCMVGAPSEPIDFSATTIIFNRPRITGSIIGGMKETQEMLDFCGKHNITSDIELIRATPETLKTAYDRTMKADVKYRFVVDIQNSFA